MAVEWNITSFQVDDLLQMAAIVEQKGYEFYSAVIDKSPERRVKNEIRFFREQEAQHKVVIQAMLKKRGKNVSGKVSQPLDAILRREFLAPVEELISSKKIEVSEEALKLGLSLEQKAIDFYTALKAMPGAESFAAELSAMITEEDGHAKKLSSMLGH